MASFIGYKIAYSPEFQVNSAKSAFVEISMEQQAIEFQQVEVRPSEFQKKIDAPLSLQKIVVSDIEKRRAPTATSPKLSNPFRVSVRRFPIAMT
jgi:hypothetical protein